MRPPVLKALGALAVLCALGIGAAAFAAPPATDGLQAYWTFDDGASSTASDSSGNGRLGTLNGTVSWASGQIGGALLFSSTTNQYVDVGADFIGTGTTTVSGWVYPRSRGQGAAGRIIDNGQFHIRTGFNNRIGVSSNGGSTTLNGLNDSLALDTWTHFAVVRGSDGSATFYINGSVAGTPGQSSGTPAPASGNLYIGNRPTGSATLAWDGYIDDVRVYSRALTSQEIADLASATSSHPDTFAPARSSGSPSGVLAVGTTQATLSLSTDEDAICKYGIVADTEYVSISDTFGTTGGTDHSSTISDLTDGGSYTYYVRCQDASGNANADDFSISFAVADEDQPALSDVSVESIRSRSAIISWTTDELATSTVSYGTTESHGSASTSPTYVTSHSVTLTGLTPGTTYHFSVSSADQSGNVSSSSDQTFTTSERDVWYVDASAEGSETGLSFEDAWTSMADINQSELNPGDIVYVYSGTYDERFVVSKSGSSASDRIIYKGVDDGGGKPVIRGVNAGAHDYIALIGFEISHYTQDYAYDAVLLSGSDGWLIQDNYIHDTYASGINLAFNTVNSENIIRSNEISRIGMVESRMHGATGVQVFGDSNLVEYNEMSMAADFFRVHGSGNIIRNNYNGYSSELEFMDGIQGVSQKLNTSGGEWDADAGTWSKSDADLSEVRINDVVRVFADDGDSYSFASVVVSTSTDTVHVRTTDYVGTLPSSGSGYSVIIVAGQHIDNFQSFESTSMLNKVLVESNWNENNLSSNSHGLIIQDTDGTNGLGWLVQRGNVYYNLGSATHIFNGFDLARIYNNTFYNPLLANTTIFNTSAIYDTHDSSDHFWINNTWNETGQSSVQPIFSIATTSHTDFYADYNHVSGGNRLNFGDNNSVLSPLFVDAASGHFALQQSSPLRDAGRYAAVAVGEGASSDTLVVSDSYLFVDGWDIAEGDSIRIGDGDYVRISNIDYDTDTITLASAVSWSDGDPIFIQGMEDVGALPYSYARGFSVQLGNDSLPEGTVDLTAIVDNPDAVRMVEYLIDGISVGLSYDPPYTVAYAADGESHEVSARAYNRWASSTLYASDVRTLDGDTSPDPDSAPDEEDPEETPAPSRSSSGRSGGGGGRYVSQIPQAQAAPAPQALTLRSFIELLVHIGVIPQNRAPEAFSVLSSSSSPAIYTRNLQLHDRGDDVSRLQTFLISKGHLAPGLSTGYFGSQTYAALKAYQAYVGLPATGYFGPLTRGRF